MRILITGAGGQAGRALAAELKGSGEIVAADRSILDLSSPATCAKALDDIQPRLIVNAAAYTAVDKAESEPELAMRVNAEAAGVFGEWAAAHDIPIIHFSTDYVFDGEGGAPYKEEDRVNPLSVYGKTKALGEQLLLQSGARGLIIRTAWVYSAAGKNFLNTIIRLAREKEELRIVDDQIGSPTSARQIALFVSHIINDRNGSFRDTLSLVHFTASGETSWHGLASAIVDGLKDRGLSLAAKAVIPIATAQYPTAARRPRDSRLSIDRARDVFGIVPDAWRAALQYELDRILAGHDPEKWKPVFG